jgi:hypothetical protein
MIPTATVDKIVNNLPRPESGDPVAAEAAMRTNLSHVAEALRGG